MKVYSLFSKSQIFGHFSQNKKSKTRQGIAIL